MRKVHWRTIHTPIAAILEGHVLGKDAAGLLSHIVPGLLPVEEADAAEGATDSEKGGEEGVGRDRSAAAAGSVRIPIASKGG